MPCERDQAIRPKRIAVVPMASRGSDQLASQLPEPAFQLPAVPGRKPFPHSGRKDKLLPESRRNGPTRFHQRLQMNLGRFLKTQQSLPPVFPMGMATRQQAGLGDPHAILIPPQTYLGNRHDHDFNLSPTPPPSIRPPKLITEWPGSHCAGAASTQALLQEGSPQRSGEV